jgi:hypothetical protein
MAAADMDPAYARKSALRVPPAGDPSRHHGDDEDPLAGRFAAAEHAGSVAAMTYSTPLWVKVFGAIVTLVILLFVALRFTMFGHH